MAVMMKENYLTHLAELANKQPKTKTYSKVPAFLAVKDDVKTALDAGYEKSFIWRDMQDTGRLNCSYRTFLGHIHRYIRQPADKNNKDKTADSSLPTATSPAGETPEVKPAAGDDSPDSAKADQSPPKGKWQLAKEKYAKQLAKEEKNGEKREKKVGDPDWVPLQVPREELKIKGFEHSAIPRKDLI